MNVQRNLLVVLTSLGLGLSSAAAARDHHVIITALGFFPQVTYVKPGDMVFFKNDADFVHEIAFVDAEQSPWVVTVQPNDSGALIVTGNSGRAYNSTSSPLEPGVLSLDPPPAEAQAN